MGRRRMLDACLGFLNHRQCSWITSSVIFAFFLTCTGADSAPPDRSQFSFGPRPRFIYTAAEIETVWSDPAESNKVAAALARAEAAVSVRRPVPEKEGQWIFYYACPSDGTRLQPVDAEHHKCPKCGKVYSDERTVAAWRTLVFNELDSEVRDLGIAYGVTKDERFALRAKEILLRLAELYAGFKRHDRWGRTGLLALVGGRRYSQLLDEAYGVIQLASGYDFVANSAHFDDSARNIIEDKLLKLIVREIQTFEIFIDARNNHQTWFNAACSVVGLVTGDCELLHAAISGKRGLLAQLEMSVTDDGLWYEGTMAYHFYAVSAIQLTLDAAKRAGWTFSGGNDRLRMLWHGPLKISYPDGTLPVFNDSDRTALSNYREYFRWAGKYFNDPVLAAMGRRDAAFELSRQSEVMSGSGIVALRRGSGKDAICVMMDYGQHGGSHGHPDKLNIVLYALGREVVLDPGRISYSVPEYKTWCRTTAAHNTVVINGRNQKEAEGSLLYFEDSPQFACCIAETANAYSGWRLARLLLLTDSWLADVFALEGRKKAVVDWFLHCRGDLGESERFRGYPGNLKGNGYEHLKNVRMSNGVASARFVLSEHGKVPIVIHAAGDNMDGGIFFLGEGIGYTLDDKVPFLMRRRREASTVFVTVYDFGADNPCVEKVEIMPIAQSGRLLRAFEAVGLKMHTKGGTVIIGADMRSVPAEKLEVNGHVFKRVAVLPQAEKDQR